MNRNEAREAVVRTGRLLEERGLTVGTGGNLSVRGEGEELVAIKPSAIPYGLMTPEDVPLLDLEGRVVEGAGVGGHMGGRQLRPLPCEPHCDGCHLPTF